MSPRMEQAASHNICSMLRVEEDAFAVLRRVTRVAALAGAVGAATVVPAGSIPDSAASATMASRVAFRGMAPPPSQRLMLAKETPSRSASCFRVKSRLARRARRVVEIVVDSVKIRQIYQMWQIGVWILLGILLPVQAAVARALVETLHIKPSPSGRGWPKAG